MIKNKISLKKLIFLTVLFITLFIVLIQSVCIGIMLNMLQEQKQTALNTMVAQSANEIEKKLGVVSTLQDYIATSSDLKALLTNAGGGESRREILSRLLFARQFFDDNVTVILVDTGGKYDVFFNPLNESEAAAVDEMCAERLQNGISDTVFFTIEEGRYRELYICSVQPLLFDTTDTVGSKNIGSSIVINRVNIYRLLRDMDYADNASLEFENTDSSQNISFMELSGENVMRSSPRKIHGTRYTVSGAMIYRSQGSSAFSIIIMLVLELFAIVVLFLCINYILLNRFITRPVQKIVGFMDNFILHNSKERLSDSAVDEFSLLSHHINTMLDNNEAVLKKIFSTQQKLYEAELSEKSAIFYSLQNQINPHFLYNTLDCINGLALSGNASEIATVTASLSAILRYALNYDSETTVDEEIHMLAEYSKILRARFGARVEMNFDFDDDIWDKKILRMLLQPLVENAVKHGLNDLQTGVLTINVEGFVTSGVLTFTVFDNGCGIMPEKLAEINARLTDDTQAVTDSSIGIVNIHRRIMLHYGSAYGLKIESAYGHYTKITVTMPES